MKFFELRDTLCIDPGLHTGIAYFDENGVIHTHEIKCENVYKTIQSRISYMTEELNMFIFLHFISVKKVYIEGVEYWSSSEKSYMSTSRGNTIMLSYFIGSYIHYLINHGYIDPYGDELEVINARQWKGTMSKIAVQKRVERITGVLYKSDHIADAVGIGLSRLSDVWNLK